MTHSPLVRWGGAALAAAALGSLPALVGAGAGTASAQTAAACGTPTPTASASRTSTPSPTATSGSTGLPVPGPIGSAISTLVPAPAPTTAGPTTSPCPTPSATATPTGTATPTTSPSATATATASPSATGTATATATTTPSPTGPAATACPSPLGLTVDRAFTEPGVPARVTITGPVGAQVELQAYSRPSTTYGVVRSGTITPSGLVFDIRPGTNTRLFARCTGQESSTSVQRVLGVRTALSLTVVRNGTRDYTFQGRLLPRRGGQTITLYRIEDDGTRVLASQIRSDSTGTYRIRRVFTGSGRFGFLTRTGQTLTNAAGESNTRDVESGQGTARPTAVF